MSMIQIVIMGLLSMHLIKETHSECFPERRVKFNDKKNIRNLPGSQMEYYDLLMTEINCTKNKKTKIDSLSYKTKKTNFNKYGNRLNKTITNTKRVYYHEIFNPCKHDMKKTWSVIS